TSVRIRTKMNASGSQRSTRRVAGLDRILSMVNLLDDRYPERGARDDKRQATQPATGYRIHLPDIPSAFAEGSIEIIGQGFHQIGDGASFPCLDIDFDWHARNQIQLAEFVEL